MKAKIHRPSAQNPYVNQQESHQIELIQSATPNTNPLRPYTKIVEIIPNHGVKEEAQQVNFDDFSLSLGTAAQASTPSDIHAGAQALPVHSSDESSHPYLQSAGKGLKAQRPLKVLTSQDLIEANSTNYHSNMNRSYTAASAYAAQARNIRIYQGENLTRNTNYEQQPAMQKTTTDFSKVKMTRSVYRQHQDKIFQEVGVSMNIRPLTNQSGTGKLILRRGPQRQSSQEYRAQDSQQAPKRPVMPQIQYSRNAARPLRIGTSDNFRIQQVTIQNNSISNQTQSTAKKAKDGGYISFQTNVDNSQAIIPMILSNDDLLRTGTDDFLANSSSREDIKKTKASKQMANLITVENQDIADHLQAVDVSVTSNNETRKNSQSNTKKQIYQNIYQQFSSDQQSQSGVNHALPMNILSDMQLTDTSFTKIVPNYSTGRAVSMMNQKRTEITTNQKSRNSQFSTNRQGKSQQQVSRSGTQMSQNQESKRSGHKFQAISQVKNFGFQSIPDFKEHRIKAVQDTYIKNISRQSQAEGINLPINELVYSTGNSYYQQKTPLFLSSTKKAPGLQKE